MSHPESVPDGATQHVVAPIPLAPPPPAMPPQPPVPAPRTGGFRLGFGAGTGAGVGLALTLVVGMIVSSVIFGVLVAVSGGSGSSQANSTETIWGSPTSPNTIHAIRISGVILADAADGSTLTGGTYGYEIAGQIDGLKASSAAGLLLIMNTPGGSINGSKAISDAVARYQKRTGKKVVVHVEGMSASGGMYAMAGADEIIADYGSLVGSIGVIMGPFAHYKNVTGTTGTLFTEGVQTTGGITEEYLTMGKGKDFGNPYRDMTSEEREVMMAGLKNIYDDFVTHVATSRKLDRAAITDKLGAHVFDPRAAIANGLIDSQMGIDEAFRRAATVMGVDPNATKVVTPSAPSMLEQLLGVQARVPGHAPTLSAGATPSAAICGATPRMLVYYGEPATVCG